jgi:pyroglutamyl-peptidase
MRIVVTGFDAFGEHGRNPSTPLAHAVAQCDARFAALAPIPVEFEGAAALVLDRATALGAHAVLALGLRATSARVTVEARAHNACTTSAPDNAGASRIGRPIAATGAPTLDTPLDVELVVGELVRAGIDAASSKDAGGYVCNDLYYRLLEAAERGVGPRWIVFVHVPEGADEQVELPRALAAGMLAALRAMP